MRVRRLNTPFPGPTAGPTAGPVGVASDPARALIPGAVYTVYAWRCVAGRVWYALIGAGDDDAPAWFDSAGFELVDRRPSRYWRASVRSDGGADALFAIEDWADDPAFHEDLLDGDPVAVEVFRGYRRLLDREFSDPDIVLAGERGRIAPWIRCPACGHEFVVHDEQGMVACPDCRAPMHNPWRVP